MKTATISALIGWLACASLLAAELTPSSTALFQSIRNGDAATLQNLLKTGADLKSLNEVGDTPLMAAGLYADAGMLKLLLKAGADVNATNQAGVTALLRAATFGE
ncbi:MAG: ankyrin repeat domain-containing protein [Verrucomicrobia bacterium]|nr:ankyrin repeat domain-containing protein [Verrucomicrobiota bacterium]